MDRQPVLEYLWCVAVAAYRCAQIPYVHGAFPSHQYLTHHAVKLRAAQSLEDAQRYDSSDNCISRCKGDNDRYCGGPRANQVYTMPPIPPPAGVPAYTYVGCYKDDQVFDYIQKPPMSIKRRKYLEQV